MLAFGLLTEAAQACSVTLGDVEIAPTAIGSAASVNVDVSVSGSAGTLNGFSLLSEPFSLGVETDVSGFITTGGEPGFEELVFGKFGAPFLLESGLLDRTVDVASGSAEALYATASGSEAVRGAPTMSSNSRRVRRLRMERTPRR